MIYDKKRKNAIESQCQDCKGPTSSIAIPIITMAVDKNISLNDYFGNVNKTLEQKANECKEGIGKRAS